MEGRFGTDNKQLEDIYEKLRTIYKKLSQDNKVIKSYPNKNSLWDQFFPAVLIMKNIELLNKQMDDLLNLTSSLNQTNDYNIEAKKENTSKDKAIKDIPSCNHIGKESIERDLGYSNSKQTTETDSPGELVFDIIKLRDQILLAKLSCNDTQKGMLLGLYEELGRILKINGIEELNNEKVFNSQLHSVVDVKATNRKELNNTIADIYRPGYRFNGKVFRAQEVSIYKYEL